MNPIYPLVNKGMMLMLATIFIIYGGLYVIQSTQADVQISCKNKLFVISGALNLAISLILVGLGRYVQTQSTTYITNVRLGVV